MSSRRRRERAESGEGTEFAHGQQASASKPWWVSLVFQAGLLAVLCLAVYANNFHHEYFLDDSHAIETNLSIRSLSNIPSYFTDAGTFSSLRANVDYRPVLMVTYALNYWMGGYDTTWWHATQILLHFCCALGLFFLCRRILLQLPATGQRDSQLAFVPFFAAAIFAAHPTAAGVINYISARSSLLAAAFILPSVVLYMAPRNDARFAIARWLSALFFALAMFTKIEAIAAIAVYFVYDVWQTSIERRHQSSFLSDVVATLRLSTLVRLWPYLAILAVYFVVRLKVMAPFQFEESRHSADVGPKEYLLTQTVVWWVYVRNWFAPFWLVADHGNFPVYRSLLTGPVAVAVTAWLAIAAVLLTQWKARPWLAFLVISALALISPTSSIAPLAEMLNEHRPYLPMAVLSLVWLIPLGMLLVAIPPARPGAGPVAWGMMLLIVSGYRTLTSQRNHAFSTNRAYLEDIIAKAPSHRPLMNYGLLFMKQGNYAKALELFNRALVYTPAWYPLHINLGIVYRAMGNPQRSREHLDLAVQYDQFSGTALSWRGEEYLRRGEYAAALQDFERARPRSLEFYRLCKGMAMASAGLGDVEQAFAQTRECLRLDPGQTAIDIVQIAKPFFDAPALTAAGLTYFERLDGVIPDTWWVHANIGTLAARLGDSTRAAAANAKAEALKGRAGPRAP